MPSTTTRPAADEYAPFYAGYIARVPGTDVLRVLREQRGSVAALLGGLDDAAGTHRYAPGKWCVNGVIGHLADAERIFAYRALRIARGDVTPLPGWDQDAYAAAGDFEARSTASLAREWASARDATLTLFDGFAEACWDHRGIANGMPVSVRALVYITAGHTAHHVAILRERYGLGAPQG